MLKRNKRGFTLIELIVVMAIIGILVMLAMPKFMGYTEKAKLTNIQNDIKVAENKVEELLVKEEEEFYKWTPVDKSVLEVARNEGKLYDRRGIVKADAEIDNGEYRIIGDDFVKKDIGSKLKGTFYTNSDGSVYYFEKPIQVKSNSIKSGTILPYSSYFYDTDKAISRINELGLNTVKIPIRVMAEDEKAENMKLVKEYGEGNDMYIVNDIEAAKGLIKRLKEEDIKVILEPFLWISDGSIGETELAPEDINAWFWSWKEDILKTIIEELAIPYGVEYLVVGTNFENLESCEGYWKDVFRDTKEKYGYEGKIIYRTNWWTTAPEWEKLGGEAEKEAKKYWEKYERKLNNSLFSDKNLDIISISAYFELTNEKNPTIETLKDSILSTKVHNRGQNVYEEVENFANKHGKKIFFGELGTIDRDYYALYPWNPGVGGNYNEDAHYNYFKAYTDLFWNEEWFIGFSIFALGDENSYYNISEKRAISFIYNLK